MHTDLHVLHTCSIILYCSSLYVHVCTACIQLYLLQLLSCILQSLHSATPPHTHNCYLLQSHYVHVSYVLLYCSLSCSSVLVYYSNDMNSFRVISILYYNVNFPSMWSIFSHPKYLPYILQCKLCNL